MTIEDFVHAVIQYCNFYQASVSSWGRTSIHNKNVGSKLTLSPHRFWLGLDVVYDDPNTQSDALRLEVARRLGLRLVLEGDHDHLQPFTWPAGDNITLKGVAE